MLREAASLPDEFSSDVRALCLTPDGRHGAAACKPGATYSVMTDTDDEPVVLAAALA
jgi:beta-aspartyl-peptidase (threonine type)